MNKKIRPLGPLGLISLVGLICLQAQTNLLYQQNLTYFVMRFGPGIIP